MMIGCVTGRDGDGSGGGDDGGGDNDVVDPGCLLVIYECPHCPLWHSLKLEHTQLSTKKASYLRLTGEASRVEISRRGGFLPLLSSESCPVHH